MTETSSESTAVGIKGFFWNSHEELMVIGYRFQYGPLFQSPYDSSSVGIYEAKLPIDHCESNTGIWRFSDITTKFFALPLDLETGSNPEKCNTNQRWVLTSMRHCEVWMYGNFYFSSVTHLSSLTFLLRKFEIFNLKSKFGESRTTNQRREVTVRKYERAVFFFLYFQFPICPPSEFASWAQLSNVEGQEGL